MFDVLYKCWIYRYRIIRVAIFEIKIENRKSYLGALWKIITPLIQIGTYWFVFGLGIRGGGPVDGYPFLIWMMAGMIPWFYINKVLSKGANIIRSKIDVAFKVKYPVETIPVGLVVKELIDHLITLCVMSVIVILHGISPNFYWLNLLYYIAYTSFFLVGLSFFTSFLGALAQDFSNFLSSMIRILFFLTPIIWSLDKMPLLVQKIYWFNPLLYIVNGFRESMLYETNFWEHPLQVLFFMTLAIVIFLLGSMLQKKYIKYYFDWV